MSQRIFIDKTLDLPNFYKVSDELYRWAQPNRKGFEKLKEMWIKTVFSLRQFHCDKKLLEWLDLEYFHLPSNALRPKEDVLKKFVDIVKNKIFTPVFVHCYHWADRTGIAVATYRIVINGWSNQSAIEEMTKWDYWFHSIWLNLTNFVNNLDKNKF